jgi:RNA polymerase sigma-70 factor (ECF subfamily)
MYARIEVAEDRDEIGDADLLRYFRRGDQSALDVLMERHRDALFRFCYHLTGNREDAEDVCQETLARAMTRGTSLQSDSAFRSWLFSIARNLSIDTHRRKKRTVTMPDDEAMPIQLYTEEPQDRVEVEEEHQTVVEAMGKLAQSHQRVLVLREVEGMSYAAIAEQLDVSQSAVETLLFRARRRLKEEYHKSAAPALALLAGIRELIFKAGGPAVGGTLAKLAASAAVVGGMALTVPHSHFTFPQVPASTTTRSHSAAGLTGQPVTHRSHTVATRYTSSVLPPSAFSPHASSSSEMAVTMPASKPLSAVSPTLHSHRATHRSAPSKSRQLRKAAPHPAAPAPQHGTSSSLPPPPPAPTTSQAPVAAPVAPVVVPTAAHVKVVPAVVQYPSTSAPPPAPTSVPQPTAAPVPTTAPVPTSAPVVAAEPSHGHQGKSGKAAAVVPVAAPASAPVVTEPSYYAKPSHPGADGSAPVTVPTVATAPAAVSTGSQTPSNLPPGQAKKAEGQSSDGKPGNGHHK